MLYAPLDFEIPLILDALVDSIAYVSSIALSYLDRIKPQAPGKIFKIDDPPNFQIQVAYCQLGKHDSNSYIWIWFQITYFYSLFRRNEETDGAHYRVTIP